jgi:hypothetical protein
MLQTPWKEADSAPIVPKAKPSFDLISNSENKMTKAQSGNCLLENSTLP